MTSNSLELTTLDFFHDVNETKFKSVCLNKQGCLKYTLLDLFEGFASNIWFDITIKGNVSYNCSSAASVAIQIWPLLINENLKLDK